MSEKISLDSSGMFYASRTYFKHFKKNVFLFKRISSILTPHYKKDEIWRQEKRS